MLTQSTAESADHCIECEQCDQIGQFQKVLGKKFLTKVAHPQIFGDFLGFLDRHHLKVNTTCGYVLGRLLNKFGLLLILTSGHTERK